MSNLQINITNQTKDDSYITKINPKLPKPGDLIDGEVIAIEGSKLIVNLGNGLIGSIQGNETKDSMNTVDTLKEGSVVKVAVIDIANEEGEIVLSLRRAAQICSWDRFINYMNTKETIVIKAYDANKGGLLCVVDGIRGFIPVSQLSPEHYPRVSNADGGLILQKLKKLVGINLHVKVINIDADNRRLVFSERETYNENRSSAIEKLAPGDIIEGTVTGVVNFGVFISFDGLEGLVHISELSWNKVESAHQLFAEGDNIKAMILGVENGRIALSVKRLTQDPWVGKASKYKIGDLIQGEVVDIAAFGALVKIEEDIIGLIHVSEFVTGKEIKPNEVDNFVSIKETTEAVIIGIDNEKHRVLLSIAQKK